MSEQLVIASPATHTRAHACRAGRQCALRGELARGGREATAGERSGGRRAPQHRLDRRRGAAGLRAGDAARRPVLKSSGARVPYVFCAEGAVSAATTHTCPRAGNPRGMHAPKWTSPARSTNAGEVRAVADGYPAPLQGAEPQVAERGLRPRCFRRHRSGREHRHRRWREAGGSRRCPDRRRSRPPCPPPHDYQATSPRRSGVPGAQLENHFDLVHCEFPPLLCGTSPISSSGAWVLREIRAGCWWSRRGGYDH